MTDEEKVYYTAREAADYLGITIYRLGRLRRLGRIKATTSGRDSTYHILELRKAKQDGTTRDLRKKEEDSETDFCIGEDRSSSVDSWTVARLAASYLVAVS